MDNRTNVGRKYIETLFDLYSTKNKTSNIFFVLYSVKRIIDFIKDISGYLMELDDELLVITKNNTLVDHIYNIIGTVLSLNIFDSHEQIGKLLSRGEDLDKFEHMFSYVFIIKNLSITPFLMKKISSDHISSWLEYFKKEKKTYLDFYQMINLSFDIVYGIILVLDKNKQLYKVNGIINKSIEHTTDGVEMYKSLDILRNYFTRRKVIEIFFHEKLNYEEFKEWDKLNKTQTNKLEIIISKYSMITDILENPQCKLFLNYIEQMK